MKSLLSIITAALVGTGLSAQAPYCEPVYSVGTNGHHFVHGVWMGDINNVFTGGDDGTYQDYTAMSSPLFLGQTHSISIIGSEWANNTYAVFIDFNQDDDFDDANEYIGEFTIDEPYETNSLLVSIPEDAATGYTRMRVRNAYGTTYIDPCAEYGYGETEDYTVYIQSYAPPVGNMVWPGDANNDGVANAWDVLNMGLTFGSSGDPRVNQGITWEGMEAIDWGVQALGTDAKFTDCNGDGTVNFSDVTAIETNYNQVQDNVVFNPLSVNGLGIQGSLSLVPRDNLGMANTGDEVLIDVYAHNISDFYGTAFSVAMPNHLVEQGTVTVDFFESAVGTINQDLIGVSYYADGVLDIGVSRNDLQTFSGTGIVATISIVIEDDVAGKNTVYYDFEMAFANVVSVNANGDISAYSTIGTKFTVEDNFSGVEDMDLIDVKISPNPNPNGKFNVVTSVNIEKVEVVDISGRLLFTQDQNSQNIQLNINQSAGVYFVRLYSAHGIATRKVIIE